MKLGIILSFAFLLYSNILFSQVNRGQDMYGNPSRRDPYNTGQTEQELLDEEKADTVGGKKEKKIKKPLLTYLFTDTLKKTNIFSWTHSPKNNNINIISIDTMLNDFQKDYIFFQDQSVGAIYLGNLGGAATQLNYFKRTSLQTFSFLDAYGEYLYNPETVKFYNGKKPFTQLSFFMSGQTKRAEEQLRVIHQQNISPSTSINLDYRNNGTRGMYNDQRSKDKNLSLAVAHTGKRLTIHSGYIYNMGDIYENGGLIDDAEVKDTLIDLPQNLKMNLSGVHNKFKGNTFFITSSYAFPFAKTDSLESIANVPAVFVGTSIEYTKYKKIYTDTKDGVTDGYYKNWYIDPQQSLDSISESLLDGKFFTQLQPYNREGIIGTIDGGIGFRNEHYYNFKLSDYISPSEKETKNSVYVYANIGGKFKKYLNWAGGFDYTPIGYRNQDLKVHGNIDFSAYVKQKPLTLSANVLYKIASPSYWSERYFSNHYMWNNSFKKENELRFGVNFLVSDYGIELGMTQAVINDKIYFDNESLPAQYSGALSVTGAYLRKDFRIGGLHLNNRVLLQWSSNQQVAPMPLASANITYFYEINVVKNVLRVQIGFDGFYNTSYYGFGYNPATMQFYNQTTTKVGNYPWMDVFISGKWKRLRFLAKLQHFNNELFGGRDYFSVAHYPLNRRMFKLGVSWNFYD